MVFRFAVGLLMTLPVALSAEPPAEPQRVQPIARPFALDQVQVTEGPFRHAQELNVRYLLRLEPDRLLAWFHKQAGLPMKATVYGGWERETLAGHTLGHYLTACSLAYRTTGDQRMRDRVDYIVAELARCQAAHGDGYVAAIPGGAKMFRQVQGGDIRSRGFDLNGIWSPFYTMHKTFAGLRDAYRLCENQQALEVLKQLGDWCWDITGQLTDQQAQQLLNCEFGGMSEVMADLYELTGEPRYWQMAARVFHHRAVLDPIEAGQDRLSGLHSNTQVPKLIGVARLYELSGEQRYRDMAQFFWQRVVQHHTYANGGNSAHEYFGPPDTLSTRLAETTETCNTYNMLRLTRRLFSWSPRAEYFDYYERALWNHILAHQHPQTGMFVYKGFLEPGAKKGFSDEENSFWCCVGSGLENHVKYNDSIYYHDPQGLYVNLFLPSKLNWTERGVQVQQQTDMPVSDRSVLRFTCAVPQSFAVRVRRPAWAGEAMQVSVNNQPVDAQLDDSGYLVIDRTWQSGDQLQLRFPLQLRVETTPDDPNLLAMLYGPVLLCADLGDATTPPVLVATQEELTKLTRTGQSLEFHATGLGRSVDVSPDEVDQFGKPVSVRLVPHHGVADQRYSVYLRRIAPADWDAYEATEKQRLEAALAVVRRTVDALRMGEMQPERDHNLDSHNSNVGEHSGKRWRDAYDGGWFAFDLKCDPTEPLELQCTYWGDERPLRDFRILLDEAEVARQQLSHNHPGQFFTERYVIPPEVTRGKTSVRVKFQAVENGRAGGLFGTVRLLKLAE